jgi:hypothetical protein
MDFKDFANEVNARVQAAASQATFTRPSATTASWRTSSHEAEMELVPPQNFRLTLRKPNDEPASVRWYPVDENLVLLASQKIREYLAGA